MNSGRWWMRLGDKLSKTTEIVAQQDGWSISVDVRHPNLLSFCRLRHMIKLCKAVLQKNHVRAKTRLSTPWESQLNLASR